ncbi:hypothetical protein CHARACLAT_031153 [Characodon lateralis]|uniref:C-type lectin domain-containing protein n=1 Tax=Characodon lateralis TaxID=208331 RepID=A0ABU7EEL4_9TELE|nr:hypothetical protein [Characodon lateralis]
MGSSLLPPIPKLCGSRLMQFILKVPEKSVRISCCNSWVWVPTYCNNNDSVIRYFSGRNFSVQPSEEPDQNLTAQPTEDMSKDLAARIPQLFCVYGAKLGHLDVDLKALSCSFKEKLATFCPSVYYISSTMKTWKESRRDCLERGADLVIINSKEEQELLRWFQNRIWIGLTDADIEGEWKWVDGTQLITSYWGLGEPNSFEGKDEDCGEINFSKQENNWNDAPCNLKKYWICEKKLQ